MYIPEHSCGMDEHGLLSWLIPEKKSDEVTASHHPGHHPVLG